MNKKIIYISIVFLLLSSGLGVLGWLSITSSNKSLSYIDKYIPLQVKVLLKDTLFYIPTMIEYKNRLIYNYDELTENYERLADEKDFINENMFPNTQLLKLNYIETDVGIKNTYELIKYGQKVNSFYIESYQDDLFISMKDGHFYYEKIKNIKENRYVPKKIITNLPNSIEVTDLLIYKNQIFISYALKDSDGCNEDALRISKAIINKNILKFENFYHQNPKNFSLPDPETCKAYNPTGGAMDILIENGRTYLLISILDQKSQNLFLPEGYRKDLTFKYAQIKKIDLESRNIVTVSSGHRNPHGLLVVNNETILSTEHGPKGGDEINKIMMNKNYGWPFVSYGEPYKFNLRDDLSYKKNHAKEGFEEPIYAFLPSIGISRIIKIPNSFSTKWQDSYFVASLKNKSLFRVKFDLNFDRVILIERIRIKKRIRDIIYDNISNTFFLALESDAGSIGVVHLN